MRDEVIDWSYCELAALRLNACAAVAAAAVLWPADWDRESTFAALTAMADRTLIDLQRHRAVNS